MQTVSILTIALGLASVAVATPPCWAPAWGWRSQHPNASSCTPMPTSTPAAMSSPAAMSTPYSSTPAVYTSTPLVSTPMPSKTCAPGDGDDECDD